MIGVHCIVPARYESSRFPGKPLVPILGRAMILRTLDRARLAGCFESVTCATDDLRIAKTVREEGYSAILTGAAATGSDRVAQAADELGLDLVVNLQGDEPVADLDMLRHVASAIKAEPDSWVTAACELADSERKQNSVVKVSVDSSEHAIEFVRKLPDESSLWFRHVGVYAYSKQARDEFHSLPQSEKEKETSLEQLRILGKRPIRIVFCRPLSASVDLPSDVKRVEKILQQKWKTNEKL
ncbi:MAG: NTP transferase domain-containing protein [Fibrobacteraceae bacterium]|nr:NTP transferase domain-containing protein [Fibrobacteraceae bacterium]